MKSTCRIAAAAAALLAFAVASPGAFAAPPSGTYGCTIFQAGTMATLAVIGTLEIRGNTYRGFEQQGPFAPYTVAGRQIGLSAGLKGLPNGWRIIEAKDARPDRAGKMMIELTYLSRINAKGFIHCVKDS